MLQDIVLVREVTVPAWLVAGCSRSLVEQSGYSCSLAVKSGFCEGPAVIMLLAMLHCDVARAKTGGAWPELKRGSWSHGQRVWGGLR